MKRLKYNKSIINDVFVTDFLLAGSRSVQIYINTKDLKYWITTRENDVLEQGQAVSQQMLRKKAKETAIRFGVIFEDEVRPKTIVN